MKCLLLSILYFALSCISITCKALDVYRFVDSRAYSMGNAVSVLPGFSNPASQGFSVSSNVSVQYMNRYGIKELTTYVGTVDYLNDYLNVGVQLSRFGYKEYNEMLISSNLYRKLNQYISIGIRLNYLRWHYSEEAHNKSVITGDIGILVRPIENFNVSVLAVNPLQTEVKIGEEKEELPVILSVGVSYEIEKCLLLTAEVEKDFSYDPVYKCGLEYTPVKYLSVRAGMMAKPFMPTFGFGVHWLPFAVDLAFSKHPCLGYNSCCALQFNF